MSPPIISFTHIIIIKVSAVDQASNFPPKEISGKLVYSRKAKCTEGALLLTGSTVALYEGDPADLFLNEYYINTDTLLGVFSDEDLERLQEGKCVDLHALQAYSNLAITLPSGAGAPSLKLEQCPLSVDYITTELSKLQVEYGNSTPCTVYGCPNVAATLLVPKVYLGPGTTPPTLCWPCADSLCLPPGSFVENLAACLCGRSKFGTFKDCKQCRMHMPCKIPGCEGGGDGTTDPKHRLCNDHEREYRRMLRDSKKSPDEIKKCIRCFSVIESGWRTHSTCLGCAGMCCHEFPDGSYCEQDACGEGRYVNLCPIHSKERQQALSKVATKRRSGELPKPDKTWTDDEANKLIELSDDLSIRRNNGDRDWDMIFKKYEEAFPNNNKSMGQMQSKMERVDKKRKKLPEAERSSYRQVTKVPKGKKTCIIEGCPKRYSLGDFCGEHQPKCVCGRRRTRIDNLCNRCRDPSKKSG